MTGLPASLRFSSAHYTLTFLAIFVLASLFSAMTFADEPPQTFRLNVSPNGYPPYLIVDQAAPSGIMWDVFSLIAGRIGYTVEAVKIPRKRVDELLFEGYFDGTPRAVEWTKHPEDFVFTAPIVTVEEVFFVPRGSDLTYDQPEDLFGKTIVTPLGYYYPVLQPHFESGAIKRFEVPRDRDMFTFARHNERFDAIVAERRLGQWLLRNLGLRDEFVSLPKNLTHFGYRIMVRKEFADFIEPFNKELRHIQENGELDAILANYR
ncbi:ABC transporter substrate-binding protein [Marinobacter salinexigens]|uniref:ABC transporter substrate-binding protein n=1 Tax=Marinobacter salinexigens TaxID=2919747 RepID=A0A5B0VGW0_9GAMM|nr:ABC transporter substrate-binding protein [Marinobacter salinexigens]KAA1173812.1 ABC transporter substrate-binding protein [Marinobacter salinexigens]